MIWCDKTWMKIWDIKPQEKFVELRVSTARKDKEGNYIHSTWFPRCVGKAANQARNFNVGDRVRAEKLQITCEPYTAKDGTKKSTYNLVIFSFEDAEDKQEMDENPVDGSDNELPF